MIAERLAKDGWSVAIHYTNSEKEAHATAKALGSASSTAPPRRRCWPR